MGKHGPCYHCGVTSTPLWRNGPPEKPVLCNACGSRWRTKGTLANYTPLHARAEPDEFEDSRFSKAKNDETKFLKRKLDDVSEFGVLRPHYSQVFHKGFDEDTSNRSSSGSAISNSESCAQYSSADASDLTGPPQPSVWDSMVPSRKRTCVSRSKISSVEKLTKDLYAILHEQQSSCLSGSSEEELLLESGIPMVSVEFGHGSVLIRHPCSITQEEESEASSLSIDNKQHTVNSRQITFPGFIEEITANSSIQGIGRMKKPANQGADEEQARRDNDQLEKFPILAHHNSPLCYVDLHEILNFEKFSTHLTNDEQKQLLKLLPSVDTLEAPYSLKRMFDSAQFNENFMSFQKLLTDGVFDNSLCGFKSEDRRILKKSILCNLTKSQWVEKYTVFKDLKCKNIVESELMGGRNALETVHSASVKRSRLGQHQKYTGSEVMMEKPSDDQKELIDKDGSFSMQSENGSLVIGSSDFDGGSYEQDLLLDVPSNGSFPQAELLPAWGFGAVPSTLYPKV